MSPPRPSDARFIPSVAVLLQLITALCLYNFKVTLDNLEKLFTVQIAAQEKRIDRIERHSAQ